jgi:hypothetical protein
MALAAAAASEPNLLSSPDRYKQCVGRVLFYGRLKSTEGVAPFNRSVAVIQPFPIRARIDPNLMQSTSMLFVDDAVNLKLSDSSLPLQCVPVHNLRCVGLNRW